MTLVCDDVAKAAVWIVEVACLTAHDILAYHLAAVITRQSGLVTVGQSKNDEEPNN